MHKLQIKGRLSLVLSPLKLYGDILKIKKNKSLIYGVPLSYKHLFKIT